MSDMVYNKGKLTPVDLNGLTLEEYAKSIVKEISIWDTYLEELLDGRYDRCKERYLLHKDVLYKIDVEKTFDGTIESFEHGYLNNDRSIDFETYHYNGGGSLIEVLHDVLNKIEENEKDNGEVIQREQ